MEDPDIPESLPFIDEKFFNRLACYSFFSWLKKGFGCVVVHEPRILKPDDIIEDLIDYLPYNDDGSFPDGAVIMVNNYDPSKEVVMVLKGQADKQVCFKLSEKELGITPIDSYRQWSILDGKGRFIPGELIYLNETVLGIEPEHYVFLGRQGVMMKICVAGIDDDGDVTVTNEEHLLHSDYEECFSRVLGVIVEGVLK